MGLLGSMTVRFGGDTSGLQTAVKGVSSMLTALPGPAGLAVGAIVGVAAAVVGIGAVSVKMAADYEQGMNKVKALTGSSDDAMRKYDTGLKQLAVDAGVGPKDLTDGLYNVLSASYKGATAMQVLTLATEDSKIGMTSAKITTDALTNVLRSFGVQSKDITRTNGEMLETVTLGKATFEQYATTIVKSASAAVQFHVSMETMNAAWSTMTSSGIRAAQASTDFQQSLKVMYGNIGTVTASLHKNGIAFDETKFNAMSYGDKVVYLNKALQEANDKHVKVTGVTLQASQAISTISKHIKDYNSNLATLSDKNAMAQKTSQAWATTQNGFNQQMDRAKAALSVLAIDIGQQLLPFLTQVAGKVAPMVTAFADWITKTHAIQNVMEFFKTTLQNIGQSMSKIDWKSVQTAFQNVGQAISKVDWGAVSKAMGTINTAMSNAALSLTKVDWKSIFSTIAIGAQNISNALSKVDWGHVFSVLLDAMKQINGFMKDTFMPTWTQLTYSFNDIKDALQPIMPQLIQVAQVIGITVVVAVILAISIFSGFIDMLASVIAGVAEFVTGVIQFMSGLLQTITSITQLIVDVFTGKWGKISTDLDNIMHGILEMFLGVWNMIKGIWTVAIGSIEGFAHGFASAIIGIFTHLSDILVGHSIIPDMVRAIVQWISQLPGKIASFAGGIINGLVSPFKSAASTIQGVLGNIGGWIGNTLGKIGNLASKITGIHIPGFASGGRNLAPGWKVVGENGPELMYTPGGTDIYRSGTGPNMGSSSSSSGNQDIYIMLDGQVLTHAVSSRQAKLVRLKQGRRAA